MYEFPKFTVPDKVFAILSDAPKRPGLPDAFLMAYQDGAIEESKRNYFYNIRSCKKKLNPLIFSNEPRRGFKIEFVNSIRDWMIVDHRGFKTYMPLEHLIFLMKNTCIYNGDITDECVYAFSGGIYILMPINHPKYQSILRV